MNYVNIDDNKLKDLMKDKENTILIDVRSEEEYEEKNIEDSINIPLNNLLYSIDDIEEFKKYLENLEVVSYNKYESGLDEWYDVLVK